MIYNENGIIINEEYILEDYFNGSHINSIINESFKDTKFAKTVSELWSKFIEKVKNGIQWLVNIPNRAKILANKKKIKDELYNFAKSDNKNVGIKFKGEVAKYIYSKGYKNGKWLNTFKDACNELEGNPESSIDSIKNILYKNGSEEEWFSAKDPSSDKIDTDEIVDFAISVDSLKKPLKESYDHLIKINKKEKKISSEMLSVISHYFTQAMSSIRNLSYTCITVCINALKGKTNDSAGIKDFSSNTNNKNQNSNNKKYPSDEFKRIVSEANKENGKEDILDVKIQLKQYALLDKSLGIFNPSFEYARKNLGNKLMQKHDGEVFNKPADEIDEDYAIGIASDLTFNFSQERVDEMRRAFKIVYSDAKPYNSK